jgi:hypothetical protein
MLMYRGRPSSGAFLSVEAGRPARPDGRTRKQTCDNPSLELRYSRSVSTAFKMEFIYG